MNKLDSLLTREHSTYNYPFEKQGFSRSNQQIDIVNVKPIRNSK